MFFSIVVPIYNVEKYLRECIDSILSQSFNDFELILVDDGSKDSSPSICDEYAKKDGRIKVIHKQNGGLSDARNVGTYEANGRYIVYIDSDDYYCDKDFLKKLHQKASETDSDVIAYKFKKYLEASNEFVECKFNCPDFDKIESLAERIDYLVKQDAFYCSAWSKSFKRSIVSANNIEFEKGLLGEDQEWYYHLLLKISSIEFLDEPFVVYRQRSNSITSSWKIKNLKDCVYIIEKWSGKIQNSELDNNYKNSLLNSVAKLYCNLLIAYTRFDDTEKKNYFNRIRDLRFLLEYNINPRVQMFYKIYKIGGFGLLMSALKVICKIK